jgi:hypothetical protein
MWLNLGKLVNKNIEYKERLNAGTCFLFTYGEIVAIVESNRDM